MTHMLDVFRVENGGVLWLESAESLECAKARVQELAASSPGEYLILDQKTGKKYIVELDGFDGTRNRLTRSSEQGDTLSEDKAVPSIEL